MKKVIATAILFLALAGSTGTAHAVLDPYGGGSRPWVCHPQRHAWTEPYCHYH